MKKLLMVVVVAVGAIAVLASRQPDDFRFSREATLNASPAAVFSHVNDLHKWEAWSPWAKLDPHAKGSYDGPATGVGSSMSWSGNRKVGEGKMTITESKPSEYVRFQLDFTKPMKVTNMAEFTFKPQGKQTVVTWSMWGKNNFVGKVMSLFMNCEKMVGGQFDQGFAALKTVSEAPVKK